nr:hypothetical protein [Tanacetum cinerariifolium]
SLAETAQNAPPTLKDPKFWTAEEKKTQKIDRLTRSLLIQGLPNDIYSLIDSNETAKDLWDALERQMRGSKYGEQDRKVAILYEYETLKANEGEQLLDTYLRYLQVINDLKKCGYKKDNCELNYKFLNNLQPEWKQYSILMRQTKNLMDINIDALYNILKQNQGDVNDALGYKKKAVVVTSDLLALVAEKMNAFNRRKFYSKPTNNNLRTSSTSQSANKKQDFVKSNDKKEDKKADEKKRDMSKVLSESDESSSSAEETIAKVAYYTSESKSESEFETSEYYDNSTNYGLFVNNDDDQEIFLDAIESASENFIENHIDSQKDYDKFEVDHNDSEEKEHLVDTKDFENQNKDLQDKYDVLKNQTTTFEMNNNELNEQLKVLIEKNDDLLAQTKVLKNQLQVKHVVIDTHVECHENYVKLEAERYEYMIRYSALFDNDKQHRKQIADKEVLFDKMSVQLVELDKHVRDLKNTILEKDFKILELKECGSNKNLEIEKCLERLNDYENKIHKMGQINQTVHMIMPSKDIMYNGRKGIGFENQRQTAKDLDYNDN